MIRFHIIGSNRSIFPGTQYPHTVVIHTKGSGIEASNHRPIRPSYRACLPLVTLQSARLCRFAQSGHSIMAELSVHPVSTNPFPSSLTLSLSLFIRGGGCSRDFYDAVCARGFSNLICIAGRRPLPCFLSFSGPRARNLVYEADT